MGRASVIQFTAPAEEAGAGQVDAWIAAAEADGEWWGEGVSAPWLDGVYDPTPGELLAALDACRVPAVTGGPDVAVGGAAGAVGAGGAGEAAGAVGAGGAGVAAGAGCAGEGLEVVVDLATWRLGVSRERARGHHSTGTTAAAAAATPTPAATATDVNAEAAATDVAPAESLAAAVPTTAANDTDAAGAAGVADAAADACTAAAPTPTPAAVAAAGAVSAPDADGAAADGAGGVVAGWVRREWVQAPMCQEVRGLLGLVPGPGLVAALSVIGRRSQCSCGRSRLAADIDVGGLPPVPGVTAGLPCACQVILTAAWQAVEGWAQVAAMAAVVDAAAPDAVVSTPSLVHRARVTDGVCSELAGALALTTAGAAGRIATARDLYRFPDLVALAEEGIVIAPVWRAVLGESTNLPADAREVVVGQMVAKIRARHAAGKAPWTPSQARQMTRYVVLRLTPAVQDEARANAFAGRRVTVTPAGDGMAWVSILMPDTDAFRVLNRLRSIANAIKTDDPTDGRNAAQRQADAAIDLLLARTSPTGHPAGCDCGCCPTTPSTTGAGAVDDAEAGPDAGAASDSATATGCVGVRCARCGRCAHHRCTCPTSTADSGVAGSEDADVEVDAAADADAADTPADTDTDADAAAHTGADAVSDAAGDADVADDAHSDASDADDSGVADSENAAEIEVIDTGADDAVTDAAPSAEGGAASAHTDSSTDDDASASVVDEGTADADPDVEADADADAGAEVDADAAAGDCTEGAGDEIEVIGESGSADLGSTGATDVDAEDNAEEEASATVPGDTTVDTETTAAATADPKPRADADADADADSEADAGADADAGAEAESGAEGNSDTVAGAEVDADRNNASGAQTDAAADAEDVAGLSEWMREVYAALDAKNNDQRTDDTAGTIEAAAPDAATTATTVDVVDVEGDALPVLGQPTTTALQPTTGPAPMPVVIDALGEPSESDPYAGIDDDRDLPPDPDPPPPWWSAQVRPPDPSHTGELCPNPVATHPATTTNPSPATGCGPIPMAATSPCPQAATGPCPGAGAAQAPAGQPQPQQQQRLGQQALLEAEGSTGPVPRSARPEISVVVDLPTLLGLTHNPALVPGIGPIDAATARALAADGTWRLLITDPATGAVVATSARTYTPTAAVARLVRAREPYCRAPGCRRQAVNSDLDHTTPWPDGDTTAANLGPLCRVHHNLKTHHAHHLTNLTTTTSSTGVDAAAAAGTTDGEQTTPTLTGWRWTLPSGLTHTHHPEPPLPE